MKAAAAFLAIALLAACAERSRLPPSADTGPNPTLPAKGWAAGEKPTAAPGMQVNAFATGLDHPRWIYVLPNGDVLVAETNAPERPEDTNGPRGWVMKAIMKKAGAAVPSANRITLLRDADGDGVAEVRVPFLEGLNSPFGMVLIDDGLYV